MALGLETGCKVNKSSPSVYISLENCSARALIPFRQHFRALSHLAGDQVICGTYSRKPRLEVYKNQKEGFQICIYDQALTAMIVSSSDRTLQYVLSSLDVVLARSGVLVQNALV
jgi:hypothetical protein